MGQLVCLSLLIKICRSLSLRGEPCYHVTDEVDPELHSTVVLTLGTG